MRKDMYERISGKEKQRRSNLDFGRGCENRERGKVRE
jgi:hypothetical protein